MVIKIVLYTEADWLDYYETKLIEYYTLQGLSLNLELGGNKNKQQSEELRLKMQIAYSLRNFKKENHPRWRSDVERYPSGKIIRRKPTGFKLSEYCKKPVEVKTNDGLIFEYSSAKEAADALNLRPTTVYTSIKRGTATRQGFQFNYL
jgi:hypothetical protein